MGSLFRLAVLLTMPLLAGCHVAGGFLGAEAASVTVFGRGVVDIGVSAATGRDCSIVYLDRGQNYCAPREHLPDEPVFCSRTIGTVSCWANPAAFVTPPRELADTPPLTSEQARSVSARWPKSLNVAD